MNENKAFWEKVKKTDPSRVKAITGKQYKGNSPQPYYLVERMTEEFGMCGIGWGINILNERMERLSDTDVLHVAVVELWYVHEGKNGSITQIGQTKAAYKKADGSYIVVDEDAPKKSVTDALTKCMSYLGFAGDIFSGQWDDSKYVQELTKEFQPKESGKSVGQAEFDKLKPERKIQIRDLATDIIADYEIKGAAVAYDLYLETKDNMDLIEEQAALRSQIPSNIRTAFTKIFNERNQHQEKAAA